MKILSFTRQVSLHLTFTFFVLFFSTAKLHAQSKPSNKPIVSTEDCSSIKLPSITFDASKSGGLTVPKSGGLTNPTVAKSGGLTNPKSGGVTVPKGGYVITLSPTAQGTLKTASEKLKTNYPGCKIKVSGHGIADKYSQQLSWDRVNVIVRFLVERTGIAENRIVFEYGVEGDPNTVDLISTMEDGPSNVPPPNPNLSERKY